MTSDPLIALAIAAGLSPEWLNVQGERKIVQAEMLRAVLKALGFPADNASDIADSRAQLEARDREAPPMLIARAGEQIALGRIRHAVIHFEDGTSATAKLSYGNEGIARMDAPAAIGYHQIEIDGDVRALAIAPARCLTIADVRPGECLSALAVQLYALRGGHTAGFGDFAALSDLVEEAARLGVDAVAISPTHARLLSSSGDISPYSPSTRFFVDPLYADVALAGGRVAKDADDDSFVDWPNATHEKLALLIEAFARFDGADLPQDFLAFCDDEGERLARHARFEALDAHFRAQGLEGWRSWPEPFQRPGGAEVDAFAREHDGAVRFHLFLQWLAAKSLEVAQAHALAVGMAVGVIADIAVGMDPRGSHAWNAPDELLLGLTIGAPPDMFNSQGQNWGLTALSPTALRQSRYDPFIATLRANMRHAGGVRIDHAMGLTRLWLVPEGAAPVDGVYLNYPVNDLLNLIALESRRQRTIVIGEDLGTVPEGFRNVQHQAGILGMEVLWFQRDGNRYLQPSDWSERSAALTTTHDLPTVAGWWQGRDIDWLEKLERKSSYGDAEAEREGRSRDRAELWSAFEHAGSATGTPPPPENPRPIVEAALDYIGRTPSPLAIVPIEDVLALPEQPNIPGTIDEHPNWRRRLPPGDALKSQIAQTNLGKLRLARTRT